MAVTTRVMDGRTTIHARRKVAGVLKQRFIPVNPNNVEQVQRAQTECERLDAQWLEEQQLAKITKSSLMDTFFKHGVLQHLKIIHSSHIDRWFIVYRPTEGAEHQLPIFTTFDKAFDSLWYVLQLPISKKTDGCGESDWLLIKHLVKRCLAEEYCTLFNIRVGSLERTKLYRAKQHITTQTT